MELEPKNQMNEKKNKFFIGEIIFAKIRGFPWWPAKITNVEIDKTKYKYSVIFYGDKSTGILFEKYINKYKDRYPLSKNIKKNYNLNNSLHDANEDIKKLNKDKIEYYFPDGKVENIECKYSALNYNTINNRQEISLEDKIFIKNKFKNKKENIMKKNNKQEMSKEFLNLFIEYLEVFIKGYKVKQIPKNDQIYINKCLKFFILRDISKFSKPKLNKILEGCKFLYNKFINNEKLLSYIKEVTYKIENLLK